MTTPMKIGIVLPHAEGDANLPGETPATLGWPAIRDFAQQAEAGGLDSVWVFDHLIMRMDDEPEAGLHEALTILTATAAVTASVELGVLVACTSFRNPALLAKMAATLDDISAGRLILGLGCGWHEPEYDAFGYEFEHRVGRFEESLDIIRPLLRGSSVTLEGRWVQARDARLLPPPGRLDIPLLIASKGPRMMRLAARDAQSWNTAWYAGPDHERFISRVAGIRAACEAAGRDPATMEITVGFSARGPGHAPRAGSAPDSSFGGSADELAARLRDWEAAGVGHVITALDIATPDALAWLAEGAARYRAG